MDELRDDLRPLVFRFFNVTTRVDSPFKGIYNASPTRKQQSSTRARPGLEPAGSMALSFGRRRPCAAEHSWWLLCYGCRWPLPPWRGRGPPRCPQRPHATLHRSTLPTTVGIFSLAVLVGKFPAGKYRVLREPGRALVELCCLRVGDAL